MIHFLFYIIFENRKKSGSVNDCLISITDCHIPQQGQAVKGNPFSSHKFAGKCALRYELGVDIIDGNLVWLEGPFPAGKFTDITIFRHTLIHHLDPLEWVMADDGYVGKAPGKVKCPCTWIDLPDEHAMQSSVPEPFFGPLLSLHKLQLMRVQN